VATCGTSYTHTAIGRRVRQPWSQVNHMHSPDEIAPVQEAYFGPRNHFYPTNWNGCHVHETAGRRWLSKDAVAGLPAE